MADNPQEIGFENPDREDTEFDDLMASVGYLMFYWTILDRAVVNQIRQLRMSEGEHAATSLKVRGTFSERLAEWQALISQKSRRNIRAGNMLSDLSAQAERINRRRKLIAHHFSGATGADAGGEASIFCSEGGVATPEAFHARVTRTEIDMLIAEVRACCSGIEGLRGLL